MAVYVTGDTHGDFRQIGDFCSVMGTKRDDVMIVLGDAGLNYFGDERDTARKTGVSRTRMTYLMIHGNHEMRPATLDGYRLIPWNGGMVYQEEPFLNLLFAKIGIGTELPVFRFLLPLGISDALSSCLAFNSCNRRFALRNCPPMDISAAWRY